MNDPSNKPYSSSHWFFTTLPPIPDALPAMVTVADSGLAHHFKTVMRARPGTPLTLVDGASGTAYTAKFLAMAGTGRLDVSVESKLPPEPQPACRVIAAIALIKGQRWEWALQKLTELGVSEIVPLAAQRSVVDVSGKANKQERWEEIIRQAAQQSERRTLPRIHPAVSVADWVNSPEARVIPVRLAALVREEPPEDWLQKNPTAPSSLVFAIGPEGDWTPEERDAFIAAGFSSVSLGPRVLRSETAAMAMAAVVNYAYNR